jgi:hypothetical protein
MIRKPIIAIVTDEHNQMPLVSLALLFHGIIKREFLRAALIIQTPVFHFDPDATERHNINIRRAYRFAG